MIDEFGGVSFDSPNNTFNDDEQIMKSPQQTTDNIENALTIAIPEDLPINQGLIEPKTEENKLLGSPNIHSPKNDTVLHGSKE